MKRKKIMIVAVLFLVMGIAGCGADKTVYYEQAAESTDLRQNGTESPESAERMADGTERSDGSKASVQVSENPADDVQMPDVADNVTTVQEEYYVYVCGAVQEPGVYMLQAGDRVCEAIVMAGGLSEDASTISVNQAEMVSDGQMIFVPTKEEADAGITMPQVSGISAGARENTDAAKDGKVNLNTASLEELMTLSGIGESRANDILAYRTEHGAFAAVEEIMNVNGIKEGLYNRIKDNIKVN